MQFGTKQVKQAEKERNLVGRSRKKVDIIIWKCSHVPLVKNRLNWMKPRQWKFYKFPVLLYLRRSGLSLFDARVYTLAPLYSQLPIHSWTLKSHQDLIRPFKEKRSTSLFVVFHKYVLPLLAGVSVGEPDGNFITLTNQTSSDLSCER